MKKILLSLFSMAMTISCLHAQTITEFHYDDMGADANEFVEVIVPADGCTYTIEFYNGSNGDLYATETVPTCTTPTTDICGSGTDGCIFAVYKSGIQNGDPDGFALIQNCAGVVAIIELLSYEGTFTPDEGVASGMLTTDVGVAESNATTEDFSSITVTAGVGEITTIATPGACPDGPLAITLTNFEVKSNDGSVMLEWSTENEINNDYFVVEHSLDGRNFSELEMIEGAGTTSEKSAYDYKHEDVINGMHYYRLKQVDFDGRFSLTAIQSVEVKSSTTVAVYPTAVANDLKVTLSENLTTDAPINIFDITGQLVLETIISVDNNTKDIDVTSLIPGTYFLILNLDGDNHTTKFMKL